MKKKDLTIDQIESKLKILLKSYKKNGLVLRGSIQTQKWKSEDDSCKQRDSVYFVYRYKGKTKSKYFGTRVPPVVKKLVENYKELKDTMEEMTNLIIALIEKGTTIEKIDKIAKETAKNVSAELKTKEMTDIFYKSMMEELERMVKQ